MPSKQEGRELDLITQVTTNKPAVPPVPISRAWAGLVAAFDGTLSKSSGWGAHQGMVLSLNSAVNKNLGRG